MSDPNNIDLNSLYSSVLQEIKNEKVQELTPTFYQSLSDLIGKLKREKYDNLDAKIHDGLIHMITGLAGLLISIRIGKASATIPINHTNMLDEEKYILDSEDEIRERKEIILSATLNGKSKLLESISIKHKTRTVVVRFLKETEQIVGADMEKYGPFKIEDVATLPFENAQALTSRQIAIKVRWED